MTNTMNATLPQAVFATQPHEKVSDKYSFVSTQEVMDMLLSDGWKVHSATEKRVRDKSREGFQTHTLRFVRDDLPTIDLKDTFSIIGRFSHDTSSAIQLMAGMIVYACSNGVIVSEGEIGTYRFIHRSISQGEIMDAVNNLTADIPVLQERVQRWKNIELSDASAREFAKAASVLRWGKTRIPGSEVDATDVLLSARRFSDRGNSLWHTFNRVQENVIKGVDYRARNGWRVSRRRTRAVNGVDQNIGLNKNLWALASRVEQGLPLLNVDAATGDLQLALN